MTAPLDHGLASVDGGLGVADGEARHTPGPWEAVIDEAGTFRIYSGPSARSICESRDRDWRSTNETGHANAALIAAAPDLLAALELMLKFVGGAPAWAIEAAQDAIRTAKGERS